ncbi:flagellar hook-basal body complex protein FliE [Pseudomonas sp. NPDC089401]|uniref:flagellar hook-basal body complex protein FliE n=1 Tax=Pseudomonas sp. NPDC089401 TaxID=3364462 RepID=UPI003804CA57
MTTQALADALQQLSSLAEQAEGVSVNRASQATGSFAGELEASLQRINRLQQTASSQANAFQAGSAEVSLSDVMADSQKASVAFQMGVQVRNRLLTAYKDVMAMQV